MKIYEIIQEGGWSSTVTQGTKITPAIIGPALGILRAFIEGFNEWLDKHGQPPVRVGTPTGSSAHHEKDLTDPERQDVIYGDIDVQIGRAHV